MTIKTLDKINQIAKAESTRLIYTRNAAYKVYQVESVRTGKPYQVSAEWIKEEGFLTLKVGLYTFDAKESVRGNGINHPNNFQNGLIAYQMLGVAKKMAAEKGKKLSFCKDYKAAKNLKNLGGEIIRIVKASGTVQWAVVR